MTTWLYRVTTRRSLNMLRDRDRRAGLLALHTEHLQPCAPTADPADTQLCRELLGQLSPQLAAVAVYRHVDGMLVREIAEVMDLRERRVAQLLANLKRELATRTRDELDGRGAPSSPSSPRSVLT